MRRLTLAIGCVSAVTVLAACQSGSRAAPDTHSASKTASPTVSVAPTFSPTPSVSRTLRVSPTTSASEPTGFGSPTSAASAPSSASIDDAICAAANLVNPDGGHCGVTSLKVSSVDPEWVYADVAVYNDQEQLASDNDEIILNLTTHATTGETNIGFCQIGGPSAGMPVGDYSSIPVAVLSSFGLSPCTPLAPTPNPASSAPATGGATTVAAFAGNWGAHEQSLTITANGTGNLKYADLGLCPSCSFGNAPVSTMTFVLTTVQTGTGVGSVTASSDPKGYAVGAPIDVKLVPGSPGQLLVFIINGQQRLPYCNATSAGQCGA